MRSVRKNLFLAVSLVCFLLTYVPVSGQFLPGVGKPLYTINWTNSDTGNYLDLVGATYDAALLASSSQDFPTSGLGGVYYYENTGNQFTLHTLATSAQALALILVDLN